MQDVKNIGKEKNTGKTKDERKDVAVNLFFKYLGDFIKKPNYFRGGTIKRVILEPEVVAEAIAFAEEKLKAKIAAKDAGYTDSDTTVGDPLNANIRSITGSLAEYAVVQALRENGIIVDVETAIGPDARKFAHADVVFQLGDRTYSLGVKASRGKNVAVISKQSAREPQIFCYVEELDNGRYAVSILGIGFKNVLNDERNRSDAAVADPNMLHKRSPKTGFIGYAYLTPWDNYISYIQNQNKAS